MKYEEFKLISSFESFILFLTVTVKIFLFNCYVSTDFEVHRNWKAITYNLPLSEWYTNETSQWTLDYPPLFAYFEKLLSLLAALTGHAEVLTLQAEPLFNDAVKTFMRSSVLLSDPLLWIVVSSLVCFTLRSTFALKYYVLTHTSLILLDNVHFQYNGLLTSMVLLSLHLLHLRRWKSAALVYAVLINFKHIYIYYAPGFVVTYLVYYFEIGSQSFFTVEGVKVLVRKGTSLFLSLLLPFILSFTPILLSSPSPSFTLSSILSRLFPVQRGLTHAYWAPNAWALYNVADLALYKGLSRRGYNFSAPQYTTGLVQEYSHSVLPTVGVRESVLCVLLSLLPLLSFLYRTRVESTVAPLPSTRPPSPVPPFSPSAHPLLPLVLSSLSFFFFGYHVHEKAVILVLFPLAVLAAQHAQYVHLLLDVSLVSSSSLGPLLFSPDVRLLRPALFLFQTCASLVFVQRSHQLPLSALLTWWRVLTTCLLFSLDIFDSFFFKWLFPSSLPFLPLLLLSTLNALILLTVFLRLSSIAWPTPSIAFAKWRCLHTESGFVHGEGVARVRSTADVRVVAAVDVQRVRQDPSCAVVTAVFFDLESHRRMRVVSEVFIHSSQYIPHFLALSECKPIAQLLLNTIASHPELTPQLVLCDGNGRFHPRGFGLACHVAATTGIATVGVAKKIDWGAVEGGHAKAVQDKFKQLLTDLPHKLGCSPLSILQGSPLTVVTHPVHHQQFVSPGLGVSMDTAVSVLLALLAHGQHPMLQVDNEARRVVEKMFK